MKESSDTPDATHGGNARHRYADVEAVRALAAGADGPESLLKEAWQRYRAPIAVTEAHLGCTREQQLRWLGEIWDAAATLREDGADIRAVTAWAAFGTQDWSTLDTRLDGQYEPGLFDVRSAPPRPTALARMAPCLSETGGYDHPALDEPGWWRLDSRRTFSVHEHGLSGLGESQRCSWVSPRTLLVMGAGGTLGSAIVRLCNERGLPVCAVGHAELDVTDPAAVEQILHETRAWAIVNAAGYVRVDDAERDRSRCRHDNIAGAVTLARACERHGVGVLTFSSDLVFDGKLRRPYLESDAVKPLSIYGSSKAEAEERIAEVMPDALVIRSAAFFGPWDDWNFLTRTLGGIAQGIPQRAASDLFVSPTFVPDLVHAALDLLIDGERGVWHLANVGAIDWAGFAREAAQLAGLNAPLVQGCSHRELGLSARRPPYSALASARGSMLPSLENGIERYVQHRPWLRDSRGHVRPNIEWTQRCCDHALITTRTDRT